MELWEANTYVTAAHPGWPGQNVYIANQGSEPVPVTFGSGAISISATFPATMSVEISGVSPVSSSLPVYVVNPTPSPVGPTDVNVVNWPVTQSVVVSGAVQISGNFATTQPTTDAFGKFAFGVSSNVLMSASNRTGFKVFNDSDSSYILYFGLTASLGAITIVIPAQWTYEDPYPGWQGPVAGIGAAAGSGTIYWTELRP